MGFDIWQIFRFGAGRTHHSIAPMCYVQVRNRFLCVCYLSPVLHFTPVLLLSTAWIWVIRECAEDSPCFIHVAEKLNCQVCMRRGQEGDAAFCRRMWRFVVEFRMDLALSDLHSASQSTEILKSFEIEWALCKGICQLDTIHKCIVCRGLCKFIAKTKRGWPWTSCHTRNSKLSKPVSPSETIYK